MALGMSAAIKEKDTDQVKSLKNPPQNSEREDVL